MEQSEGIFMQKKIDPLGRIGIPKYIRKDMGLEENGTVFIDYNFEEKEIRIKKAETVCAICGCHLRMQYRSFYDPFKSIPLQSLS